MAYLDDAKTKLTYINAHIDKINPENLEEIQNYTNRINALNESPDTEAEQKLGFRYG